MPTSHSTHEQIASLITAEQVVLFMKGTRSAPQCGFSAQVVQILDELVPRYKTIDVLSAPEIREGVKTYSNWPTIPQLYVGGNFIGGCDIVRELYASGELRALLGAKDSETSVAKADPEDTDEVQDLAADERLIRGVSQLEPKRLKAMLDRQEIVLFDVRPDSERNIAKIAAAKSLDPAGQEYLFSLEPNTKIALHCHHGSRSQKVAEQLLSEGFRRVYNLRGGIEAWSRTVDASVPRY